MPIIGFSNPYIADYVHDGAGGVTYRNGMRAGRGVSRSITPEAASADNNFYCDNAEGESDTGVFKSATLSLELAELTAGAQKRMLGAKTKQREINGKTVETVDFADSMTPPYLGYGDIEKDMEHGQTLWTAIILKKVKFKTPTKSATTQGESISWQTQTIEAEAKKDDTADHSWQEFAQFESESEADSFVRHMLGITGSEVETLTVVSTPGSKVGNTSIAVEQDLVNGRSYRYKTGKSLTEPSLYASLTDWAKWDGVSEIAAEDGDDIIIAEVDVVGLAMAAGKTTVESKTEE